MQSDEGRGLYRAILASLQGFFSPDSRELEWDVLPRTIAWKLTQFQRERDEAVGRLSAARAEGEAAGRAWQPIETAPKMRKIIVFYRNALGKRRTVMACYYKARSLEMEDDYAEAGVYDDETGDCFAPEGWYEEHDSDNPLMPLQEEPTHWMPLPEPPEAAPSAAREGGA
jgi:hypothetical protein